MGNFDYQYGVIETQSSRHNFQDEIGKASIAHRIGELFVNGKDHSFKLEQITKITLFQSYQGIKTQIPILQNGDQYVRIEKITKDE